MRTWTIKTSVKDPAASIAMWNEASAKYASATGQRRTYTLVSVDGQTPTGRTKITVSVVQEIA